jgi:hypothetical protein
VTPAELEPVEPDAGRARDFVVQSRIFLEDADRETTSLQGAVVLYWNACIAAMDALLAFEGLRVGSGEGSHSVRVRGCRGILGTGFDDLCDRLDERRRDRHDVSSAAITPGAADVAALQTDARDILAAAEVHISTHRNREG